MPLVAGTRLGPYEILAPIGSGGMGEVYRARDPRLGRDIAIKVLPSGDAEHRLRFELEARAVAALNHPNIVTIHSVEVANGLSFFTMELVEGQPLSELIPRGGMPVDRLLALAIPLSDAVAIAHAKGITHRDLKPANVMVTSDGRVKVLDFGLAKLREPVDAAAGVSTLPTQAITGEGRIVGTVAYMSPEQAEGRPVDPRSDVFSLGVILYELATGIRPFTGETSISIISAIVKDTPKSVSELNSAIPRDFGRIVRRALTKDPERRYQTAKDLRNDLETLRDDLTSGQSRSLVHKSARTRSVASWFMVGATLLGLASVLYVGMIRRSSPMAPSQSGLDLEVTQLTTSGNAKWPAISPDGKYVAYIQHNGNGDSLWIRQTSTSSNVQIVPAEPDVALLGSTVTPDASYVDFVRRRKGGFNSELWRVPFLGGTPRSLIDNIDSLVDWSSDRQHMAFVRSDRQNGTSELLVADVDGSHERAIATRRGTAGFMSLSVAGRPSVRPAWAPNDRVIATVDYDLKPRFMIRVVFIDPTTGSEKALPIPGTNSGLAWVSETSLVVCESSSGMGPGQLWRLSYPDGKLFRLTNDLDNYDGISLTLDRSALVTARIVHRVSVWIGDGGAIEMTERVPPVLVDANGFNSTIAWASDRLLYPANGGAIWGVHPNRGSPEEIVASGMFPAPTSDGRTIVYVQFESDPGLWKVDGDGGHATRLLGELAFGPVVTRDDRYVIFISGLQTPWIMPLQGGTPTQLVDLRTLSVDVSPDGRSIVLVTTDAQNRNTLIACDLPGCTSRRTLTPPVDGSVTSRWTPDGHGIGYVDSSTQSNLWIQPLDGTAPHQVTHFTDGRTIMDFAWSRDGERLAIARAAVTNDVALFKRLNGKK